MGKIFGISDLPVSTLHSALYPSDYRPPEQQVLYQNYESKVDKFVSKEKSKSSNPFIKMRNGFGKLMKHFSKVK